MVSRMTVCIPVYNGAEYIADAVTSVLDQTHSALQLIVVDNASTDGTAEIVERFRDPRLTVVRNTAHLGPAGNWNRALDAASGGYVKILCADDLLAPECVEKQMAVLEADRAGEIAMVCSRRDIINSSGHILLRARGLPGMEGRVPGAEAVRRCVRSGGNPFGEAGAVLFRTEATRNAGPFTDRFPYLMDVDFCCRVLEQGDLYAIPEPLASFRTHAGSASAALVRDQTAQTLALMSEVSERPSSQVGEADLAVGALRARLLPRARRAAGSRWLRHVAAPGSVPARVASRLL